MRRHIAFAAAAVSFLILLALLIWQGSFRIEYSPSGLSETVAVWAVSTIIFLLTVALAFMLFRAGVKAYIDRQRNREGSRIRSKLLAGALLLTLAPALFYVVFSVYVLNRHLDTWFNRPAKNVRADLDDLNAAYQSEARERVQADTNWIALLPQTVEAATTGHVDAIFFRSLAQKHGLHQMLVERPGHVPVLLSQQFERSSAPWIRAAARVTNRGSTVGQLQVVGATAPEDVQKELAAKAESVRRYTEAEAGRTKLYQDTYFRLICLITLFVLFFASWSAQILSRQISVPISALLGAAQEVRTGNLSYRVRVNAMDELATLVRAFNEMTSELEANARELEARRRFTEAILESIPTGVISISSDEHIERVNRALSGIFQQEIVSNAKRLGDLFSPEDLSEIRYLLKRARRTGTASSQLQIQRGAGILHAAITVASLRQQRGFVLVLEDMTDLLRAQKATAWQEVARRIAHEIKNPLTPISLSADRISRQLQKIELPENARAILSECTQTIQQEVQTVKSLVDEFSQFSRFPAANPVPSDLNEIVESAMAVFAGRLENINISVDLDRGLAPVLADREQIKRVIVNLIDNAAEAMNDSPVQELRVATAQLSGDSAELSVVDTGPGVSAEDKEKLFLPYFSTKARGTGLGLAIVSRIVAEHHGRVRVEDNEPTGARFVIELNTVPALDTGSSELIPVTGVSET